MNAIPELTDGSTVSLLLAKITLLLAAGWMLHLWLRGRNPRWRVLLWRGVMMGLVLLPILEILVPRLTVPVPEQAAPYIVQVVYRPLGYRPVIPALDLAAAAPPSPAPPSPTILEWIGSYAGYVVLMFWGLVALVLLARVGLVARRVRRMIDESRPASPAARAILNRVGADLGCHRRIDLRVTSDLASPFLAGILRPVILLPAHMVAPSCTEQLGAVFAHELAHLRSHDMSWMLLAKCLVSQLWFHPLAWRMGAAHARACEQVCDAVAADYVGGAPVYSSILARIALDLMVDMPAHGGISMIRTSRILERLQALRRGIRAAALARRWVLVATLSGSLVLLVLGCLRIVQTGKSDRPAASEPSATTRPERKPVMSSSATVKREGSRVWIENVPNLPIGRSWDNYCRGMQVLLAHRGDKADIEDLLAFSGEAFNLCHAEHWRWGAQHLCIPTDPLSNLASAYGYLARWLMDDLLFYQINKLPADQKQRRLNDLHEQLYKEIGAGRPVFMGGAYGECGEWRVVAGYDRDHHLLCYVGGQEPYEWTDYTKDPKVAEFGFWDSQVRGTACGTNTGGWRTNAAFIIGEKAAPPGLRTGALAALSRAVQLFAPAQVTWDGTANYFGQSAYEAFARELAALDYPADIRKERPKGQADWYTLTNIDFEIDAIVQRRTAAASFCEKQAAALPAGKQNLLEAARLYRDEVAIACDVFATFLPPSDKVDSARAAWLSDPKKRQAGVQAVRAMLEKERAAIEQIRLALTAEGQPVALPSPAVAAVPTTQATRATSKSVDNVPTLAWGTDRECTFIGAMEAALAATKHPYAYADMMGYSGLALRVRWYQEASGKGCCPSSPVGEFFGEITAVDKATGWPLQVKFHMDEQAPDMAKYRAEIVASIDAGKPVLAYGKDLNLTVIYGYDDGGSTLLVRDYRKRDDGGKEPLRLAPAKLGPFLVFLGEHREPLPRREVLLQALATSNWRREVMRNGDKGNWWYGPIALQRWADAIVQADDNTPAEREKLFFVSWWNMSALYDARLAAVKFLRGHADILTSNARQALERAADLYEQEKDLLGTVMVRKDAFLGPWSGKTIADWTPEVRQREHDILLECRKIEADAAAQLDKALAAEKGELKPLPADARAASAVSAAPTSHPAAASAARPAAASSSQSAAAPSSQPVAGRQVLLAGVEKILQQATQETTRVTGTAEPDLNPIRTDLLTQVAFMRAAGLKDIDYETLVMLTGYATSFAYHPKRYQVMYQPPDTPAQTQQRVAQATGWVFEWVTVNSADEAWTVITQALDAGHPVQARWFDDWVIVGYRDAPNKADRQFYNIGGWDPTRWQSYTKLEDWAKNFKHLGRQGEPVAVQPAQAMTVEVLKRIAEYAKGDARAAAPANKEASFGLAGIEAYAADVADVSKTPDSFDAGWLCCHCINRQTSGRKCAAAWLRRVAPQLPEKARPHLLAAADEYDAAWADWQAFKTVLGGGTGAKAEDLKKAWAVPEKRTAGATKIRGAAAHEKSAVEAITRALAELG